MSKVDIALLIIISFGAIGGYKNGFLLEVFFLLAIVLGVLIGFKFMGWAMVWLDEQFNINEKILPYAAFGILFLVIVILVNLIGKSLSYSIDKTFLGKVDKVAGMLLGVAKTAFMVSILLWIFESLTFSFPEEWTEDSEVMPIVAHIAPKTAHWIGGFIPFFDDVF